MSWEETFQLDDEINVKYDELMFNTSRPKLIYGKPKPNISNETFYILKNINCQEFLFHIMKLVCWICVK